MTSPARSATTIVLVLGRVLGRVVCSIELSSFIGTADHRAHKGSVKSETFSACRRLRHERDPPALHRNERIPRPFSAKPRKVTHEGGDATGRPWSSSCTAIFEVDEGRIVDFWMTWDVLDILEQLRVVRRAAEVSA